MNNSPPAFDTSKANKSNTNGSPTSASLLGGPGAGGGVTSAQPAPATEPDSSSSSRHVNTSQAARPGAVVGFEGVETQNEKAKEPKKPVVQRFWRVFKAVLFHSKVNVLLAFVPVGIAVANVGGLSPGLIFAMNALAIVPLAGLLSYATESVAHKLGDSLGALLNVTFGNAVELIIL